MKKIGITGGIGSGKSVVAELLKLHGIPVYIADEESKRLTSTSPVIKAKLIELLGPELYTGERLNKPRLASYIFRDERILQEVNHIIHPEVNKDFENWCIRQKTPLCAIESAILFESGFNRIVDTCLMVYAPIDIRIERALLRDKTSRDAIRQRINSQMPDEAKREKADFTILNDGKQALIPQVEKFLLQYAENIP